MNRDDIKKEFLKSKIITGSWHWYSYHFRQYLTGGGHPFVESLLDKLFSCEMKIPGIAEKYVQAISTIEGREKCEKDYDQLIQILAEIVIVSRAMEYDWEDGTSFTHEPTGTLGAKNPELKIEEPSGLKLLIEVKAPNYLRNANIRIKNQTQLPARSEIINSVDKDKTTLPRDNPIKDFLISADEKFNNFKPKTDYFNILFIVSDDYVQEVISPLCSPLSGLLTEKSFAKEEGSGILEYENVDLIIVTRHLLNIAKCLGDAGPVDSYREAMDYGVKFDFKSGVGFPPKVFYKNPFHQVEISEKVLDCFQLLDPNDPNQPPLGGEYLPSDIITWFD